VNIGFHPVGEKPEIAVGDTCRCARSIGVHPELDHAMVGVGKDIGLDRLPGRDQPREDRACRLDRRLAILAGEHPQQRRLEPLQGRGRVVVPDQPEIVESRRLAGDSPIARCWSASSPRQLPVLLVLAGALAVGTVAHAQTSRSDIVWQDNVQTSVTSMRSANGANIAWAFPSAATYSSCTKNLESPPGGPDGHLHHPKSDKYCIRTTEGNVALFENVTYNIHSSLPGVIDSITVVARYTLWNKQ
jgi:hypothetical protein